MSDQRPRSQRPRVRGKGQKIDPAILQRKHQSVRALQEVLQPEAEALKSSTSRKDVVDQIRARAVELAQQSDREDVAPIVEAALDEIFGLGPLEPLLRDTSVQVIRLDGIHLYADAEPVSWGFRDDAHARQVVDRILASVDKSLEPSGDVKVKMMDGSSFSARLAGSSLQVRIARP